MTVRCAVRYVAEVMECVAEKSASCGSVSEFLFAISQPYS